MPMQQSATGSAGNPGVGPPPGEAVGAAFRLVRDPIDGAAVLAAVASPEAGGNVLFLGSTRGLTAGVTTLGLDYEAHEPLALDMLRELGAEAVRRFGLCGCAIVHRLGRVAVGEASIAIAVSAPHRREAFSAAEWLLERVKTTVPIWKCEEGPEGLRTWVHPGDMRTESGGGG